MTLFHLIVLAILYTLNAEAKPTLPNLPKLLVVSYDGFRYDLFDRKEVSFMKELKESGTHADYMKNAFVTKTFPNHQTIATGLYVESHRVIDSGWWNTTSNSSIKYCPELYQHNKEVICPIWTLNELSGGRSGVMMWPGNEFEYNCHKQHGPNSTFIRKYNKTVSHEERIDEVLSWYVHPKTAINFGMLYIENPDKTGHCFGTNSIQFNEKLQTMDETTKYLHDKINELGLTDLNVIHLSDHGMADVTIERIVNLTDFVNPNDYRVLGGSPVLHVYPNTGKESLVYKNLRRGAELTKKYDVYLKSEIPERYHYSNNPSVGPILLIAKVGYAFQDFYSTITWARETCYSTTEINEKTEFGLHGYDNDADEMHPFFFGVGPAFEPECKVPPFESVNLMSLFCDILHVPCSKNNGTLGELQQCLTKHDPTTLLHE